MPLTFKPVEKPVVLDCETYRNYFLAAFRSLKTGKTLTFERGPGMDFDREHLRKVMRANTTVGFNSNAFDLIVIEMALRGFSTEDIKQTANAIIVAGLKPWEAERLHDIRIPRYDHIDLIEVAPGQASLKLYGGRLHAPKLQDLPYDPDLDLTPEQMREIYVYCGNDLDTTGLLFEGLREQIDLRVSLSNQYGIDLRSKSDAQIAEAVIKSQITKISGDTPQRPTVKAGTSYKYRVPSFIKYRSEPLRKMLDLVRAANFKVSKTGKIEMPKALEELKIEFAGNVFRMGIGGLHSSEKKVAHFADADTILVDRDVTSYYPAIILNLGLAPKHIGNDFLSVYKSIVDQRVRAKRAGNKVAADSLKITVNGSFGKLGSQWSALYSPDLMIQVTVTGQLSLLLLIERLLMAGIPVVSANTDGVVIKCPKSRAERMEQVVAQWEKETGFGTEEKRYEAIYCRDVNNYIAVVDNLIDYETKLKGAYAKPGLQKNPANQICVTAVVAYLTKGTPVSETIYACKDIKQFLCVRNVRGGAEHEGRYLGRVVRWYYASGATAAIHYVSNGNTVARTDGCKPIMDLPGEFPDDVNHGWYIEEARSILRDIGVQGDIEDPTLKLVG